MPNRCQSWPAGYVQPDPGEGEDARFAAAYGGYAFDDPPLAPESRASAGSVLAGAASGDGGLAGAEFRPGALRKSGAGAAKRTVYHHSHRYRRLPAALLD